MSRQSIMLGLKSTMRRLLVILLFQILPTSCLFAVQDRQEYQPGLLVCFQGAGKGNGTVSLMDGDKKLWTITGLNRPKHAEQLPNGNVMISEYGYNPYTDRLQVTERTPENKIVWKHVANDPVASFRLSDGKTIVAAERQVYLVNEEGESIRNLYDAPRQLVRGGGLLPDNTFGFFRSASENSLLIEVDLKGNVIRETELDGGGATGLFEVLPNGHLLIPMTYRNKVIELDVNRKPVGTFVEIQQPIGVQRLPGGNVAVTTWRSGVVTFDRKGNKLGVQEFDRTIYAARFCSKPSTYRAFTQFSKDVTSLVCDYQSVTLMQDGKAIWTIDDLSSPYAELLPSGNVLIAERGTSAAEQEAMSITERSATGKVLWTHKTKTPVYCTRLNENQFCVATTSSLYFLDREGNRKNVYSKERVQIRGGGKLKDGGVGILIRQSYEKHGSTLLVEFSAAGKRIRETELDGVIVGTFESLPNGNLLLPVTNAVPGDQHKFGQVIELNRERKVEKVFAKLPEPIAVHWAPDGNIWVSSRELGIVVYSGTGRRLHVEKVANIAHANHYFGEKSTTALSRTHRNRMSRFKSNLAEAASWIAALGARIDRDESQKGSPVVEIDLYNYYRDQSKVTDEVLEVIGLFKELRVLNVANSPISDRGVTRLATLRNLTELNLESTAVTDKGIAAISSLSSLRSVNLSRTAVGNGGLQKLVNANLNLEELDLSNTNVNSEGIAELASLKQLKKLIPPDSISNSSLEKIARLESLEHIVVSGDKLSSESIAQLSRLKNLKTLHLKGTAISDDGLFALTQLKGLRELNLTASHRLSPKGFGSIAKMRQLRRLVLRNCNVEDSSLEQISTLGYLEELNLQGTNITNKGLFFLANTITLQHLYLEGNQFSSNTIRQMKRIELPYCRFTFRDSQ